MYVQEVENLKNIFGMSELIRTPKEILKALEEHKKVTIMSGNKPVMEIIKPKE